MSERFQMHQPHPMTQIVPAGTQVGYDEIPDGQLAVVVGDPYDGASVLCGSADEIVEWLTATADAVRQAAALPVSDRAEIDVEELRARVTRDRGRFAGVNTELLAAIEQLPATPSTERLAAVRELLEHTGYAPDKDVAFDMLAYLEAAAGVQS